MILETSSIDAHTELKRLYTFVIYIGVLNKGIITFFLIKLGIIELMNE